MVSITVCKLATTTSSNHIMGFACKQCELCHVIIPAIVLIAIP